MNSTSVVRRTGAEKNVMPKAEIVFDVNHERRCSVLVFARNASRPARDISSMCQQKRKAVL